MPLSPQEGKGRLTKNQRLTMQYAFMYLTTLTIHVVREWTWTWKSISLTVRLERPSYLQVKSQLGHHSLGKFYQYLIIESGCGFLPAPNKRHLRKPVLNKIAAPVSERRLTMREYGIFM